MGGENANLAALQLHKTDKLSTGETKAAESCGPHPVSKLSSPLTWITDCACVDVTVYLEIVPHLLVCAATLCI